MANSMHAVVNDGVVTEVALMTAEVADKFRELGFADMLWPGGELVDVTDVYPQPPIGWLYGDKTFSAPLPEPTEGVSDPVEQTSPATSAETSPVSS